MPTPQLPPQATAPIRQRILTLREEAKAQPDPGERDRRNRAADELHALLTRLENPNAPIAP